MRTSIDLPDTLLREAKVRAAQHDETLKQLVTRALERELSRPAQRRSRVALPLVDRTITGVSTNADIERILDADDAAGLDA